MKSDIRTEDDIIHLVNTFYESVRQNEIIGPIFNNIIKDNWSAHLPKMYSFWSSLLLGAQTYHGNPMVTHIELSRKVSLTELEFSTWIHLFVETVNSLFEGPIAEDAKTRAANIARLMLHKVVLSSKL